MLKCQIFLNKSVARIRTEYLGVFTIVYDKAPPTSIGKAKTLNFSYEKKTQLSPYFNFDR